MTDSSLERAVADVELLQAAYPEEVELSRGATMSIATTDDEKTTHNNSSLAFPIHIRLNLSNDTHVILEYSEGYPVRSGLSVISYRSNEKNKKRIEHVVSAIRNASADCLSEETEAGLSCCAAAMEAWNDYPQEENGNADDTCATFVNGGVHDTSKEPLVPRICVEWTTGEPFVDRKSTFQAHVCRVETEKAVHEALHQLLDGNSKLQRATHNMYAYRLTEILEDGTSVSKFDNDDDGEDGAGRCLAQLLELRKETNVLVLVSRWFGGIHLGPRRFAHINNVARELLAECHGTKWNE